VFCIGFVSVVRLQILFFFTFIHIHSLLNEITASSN
jgi:hypothetical protein